MDPEVSEHPFTPKEDNPLECSVCSLPERAGVHITVLAPTDVLKVLTITLGPGGLNMAFQNFWTAEELALLSMVIQDAARSTLANANLPTGPNGPQDHKVKKGQRRN